MKFVTPIIVLSLILGLFLGCNQQKPKMEYKLPDKFEHPRPGWVKCLSPKVFIDTVNSGTYLDIYFLQDMPSTEATYNVFVPGMQTMNIGEFFSLIDTLKATRPLYLLCLYGDDSRKASYEAAKRGLNCFYIDGGSYRLAQEMQKNKWTIMPQPWRESTAIKP